LLALMTPEQWQQFQTLCAVLAVGALWFLAGKK
jgi:hypothetical protein